MLEVGRSWKKEAFEEGNRRVLEEVVNVTLPEMLDTVW